MVTKLKKSVALILAMIMSLTLAACGNDSGSTSSASTEPEARSEIQTGATVRSSDALSIRGGNVDGAENEVREWVRGLGRD